MRTPLLLPAALMLTIPSVQAQTPVDASFAALLQAKLDSCRVVYEVPGISATILLPGDRYWNGVSGLADIYNEEPMDTAYVFQAASVTKLFTATIIFQLIEEGLLDLDDTLGSYLLPLPNVPGDTRIRYLLNHRSGIAEYLGVDGVFDNWFNYPDSIWPPELVLTTYNAPPDFEQNTSWSYSNTNYLLLGLLIEQITGNTFAQELQARITGPLGLEHTFFPPQWPVQDALVQGWSSFQFQNTYDTDVTPVLQDCFASMAFTAGALVARPADFARFTRAVMTGAMFSTASLITMQTCTAVTFGDGCNGYGHGTMRYTYAGRDYFGHSGDISGFTEMSIHGMEDSVTFTLSMNRNGAPRGLIAAAMLATVHQGLEVGVPTIGEAPDFVLYPVPATDRTTLRSASLSANDRIDLLDASGRLVRSERCAHAGAHELSVLGLAPGAYRVRWSGAAGVAQRALIVR